MKTAQFISEMKWSFVANGVHQHLIDGRSLTLVYIRPPAIMAVDNRSHRGTRQRTFETRTKAADWLANRCGLAVGRHVFERL